MKAWSHRESFGVSSRSRVEGSMISFGHRDFDDVIVPHNDALVIRSRVSNYEVQKVFVDSGSSVDVIFQKEFSQMDIQ